MEASAHRNRGRFGRLDRLKLGAVGLGGVIAVWATHGCAMDNPAFGKSPAVGTGDGSGDGGSDAGGTVTDADDDATAGEDVLDGPPAQDSTDTTAGEDGGSETGDEFERVRCAGLLWGVNEAGRIIRIDVRTEVSMVTANVDANIWAAATARSGLLVIVPKGANAPVFGVDPMTGEMTEQYLDSLVNTDEASRAAMHPDGSLWVGTFGANAAPSDLLRVKLSEGVLEPIASLEALPEGGDHILTSDSNLITVGFDGRVAVVSAVQDDEPVFIHNGQLGPVGSQWTGIARSDGSFWVSESDGTIYALESDVLGGGFTLGQSFQAAENIDDLAPVVLGMDACPYGPEDE